MSDTCKFRDRFDGVKFDAIGIESEIDEGDFLKNRNILDEWKPQAIFCIKSALSASN